VNEVPAISRPVARPGIESRGGKAQWGAWIALAIITILFALTFSWLAVARHQAFQSHAFDLGNMDQAVWNTLHGSFLRFTDMEVRGSVLTSRLAIHNEPLLAVFAFLYLFHSGPETLLIAQAVVVSLGAVPMYLLARAVTGNVWLSLVFPVAYVLHPSLQNAVLDDFHAVTLSACFLSWGLYFAYRGVLKGYIPFAILAAATKEETALLAGMLGLLLIRHGRRWAGLTAVVLGLGWFLAGVAAIIPAHNPSGHSPYLSRYAYLGHGLGGLLLAPVRRPGVVVHTLLSQPRLTYLTNILHPVGFVALLGFPIFLLAFPALLANMLSADPSMYSGYYQYSAEVVPYAVGAAAIGVGTCMEWARRAHPSGSRWIGPVLCSMVLSASALDSWQFGFTPLSRGYIIPSAGAHQTLENRIVAGIPPGDVVAAADEIEPHLADRRWIYLLPTVHPRNGPEVQTIVLDASIPSSPTRQRTLHSAALTALRHGFSVASARDGILVLRRAAGPKRLPHKFFSFIFAPATHVQIEHAVWGPLALTGAIVHPRDGLVNRARPAIGVETYWRASRGLPAGVRIVFRLSPVYSGPHPPASAQWLEETDSPTWDWLPLTSWPAGRTIRAASVPLAPPPYRSGKVDVAISVEGLGTVRGVPGASRILGSTNEIRVATIAVQP
jgi:uncharacterized membrane protein